MLASATVECGARTNDSMPLKCTSPISSKIGSHGVDLLLKIVNTYSNYLCERLLEYSGGMTYQILKRGTKGSVGYCRCVGGVIFPFFLYGELQ